MKTLGIIPARFASVRFPGKPLTEIGGKTMIQRVWEQARKANSLADLVVATDDQRIFDHVRTFGNCLMTGSDHRSGTDRCAEVAALPGFSDFDAVLNIQGDEPFIQPEQIDWLLHFLEENEQFPIATLAKRMENPAHLSNPNVVKLLFDASHRALYFSRSPIPFVRGVAPENWLEHAVFYKHIGLYAFRREALLQVAALPPGRLEQAESLEQLRWLENGFGIGVAVTEMETVGIDAPEDLERVEKFIAANSDSSPDFGDELSDAQKRQIEMSIRQFDNGEGIPHETVMRELRTKYRRAK